jgi:mRNA-degrading endonuclease toxin of MazEF toxin-antitoxin module
MVGAKTAHHTLFQLTLKNQVENVVKCAKLQTAPKTKLFLKMENANHAQLGQSHNKVQKCVDQIFAEPVKSY